MDINQENFDKLIEHINHQDEVIGCLCLRLERLEFVASVRELTQAVSQELLALEYDDLLRTLGFSSLSLKQPSKEEFSKAFEAYTLKCIGNAKREHLDKVYIRNYVDPYNQFLQEEANSADETPEDSQLTEQEADSLG